MSKIHSLFKKKNTFDSFQESLSKGTIPQSVRLEVGDRFYFETGILKDLEFSVIKILGRGGFGTVYSIRNGGQKYACKVLDLWMQQPGDWASMVARFHRGFKAGQIKSPYLVRLLHETRYKGNPCVIMELCEAKSLADRMEDFREEVKFTEFALKVLKGLQKLHENGIIHRDIKPENILFDNTNTPKLTDFDISIFINKRQTLRNWRGYAKEVWGTAIYAPPEQLDPKLAYAKATPAMDMFAFGVTMYEIISGGKYPFGGFEEFEKNPLEFYEKVKKGDFVPLEKVRPDFSTKWTNIINACLHPDYNQRINNPSIILNHFDKKNNKKTNKREITDKIFWQLIIKNGEEVGKIYDLSNYIKNQEELILTIGRLDMDNPENSHINILETYTNYISRKHATLKYTQNQWLIRDGQSINKNNWKPSLNGTITNERTVGSNEFYPLKENQIIILAGDVSLKLEASK